MFPVRSRRMGHGHRIPLYLGAGCEMNWLVEEVDEHENAVEIIAAACSITIAEPAYRAAVASRPGQRIMLRERARVVRRSWEPRRVVKS